MPTPTRLDLLADILAREFRIAAPEFVGQRLTISWPKESEEIHIDTPSGLYVMWIGSDDDGFDFRNGSRYITFDFPQDWTDLNEAPGWENEPEPRVVYPR